MMMLQWQSLIKQGLDEDDLADFPIKNPWEFDNKSWREGRNNPVENTMVPELSRCCFAWNESTTRRLVNIRHWRRFLALSRSKALEIIPNSEEIDFDEKMQKY